MKVNRVQNEGDVTDYYFQNNELNQSNIAW